MESERRFSAERENPHCVNRLPDGLLGITTPLLRIATGFVATTLSVSTLLRRAVMP